MPDWNSRLAVEYDDDQGNHVEIKPIDSFTPSFSLSAEPLHSIEETHIGVIYSPDALSFTLTVKAIGPVAAQLTVLALEGRRFNVTLKEAETSQGDDWSFDTVVMTDCVITSATPTAATISGAPAATFSGFALGGNVTDKASTTAVVP